MKRALFNKLNLWKESSRRKPLLLRGARQVGKTYLLKNFGKECFEETAYFNFEKDPLLNTLFQGTKNPQSVLERLRIHSSCKIQPEKTLLIFDEIQESPTALNSLKYFCEEASQYAVAAAGSLLGVKMAREGFPVGKVHFLTLYPLTVLEFIDALGEASLAKYLVDTQKPEPIPNAFHEKLLDILKTYLITGGMPEAVQAYLDKRDFEFVREVQEDILRSYELDFAKHAPSRDIPKLSALWQAIPSQLMHDNKKFFFSRLKKGARFKEYEEVLQWLTDAGLAYRCLETSTAKVPLAHYADPSAFRLFSLDVGLLSCMAHVSPKTILEKNTLFVEFKGALTENLVAQELVAQGHFLFYWVSKGIAEVDFLIEMDGKVVPVEVKSGENVRSRSLVVYAQKNPGPILRVSPLNLKLDGKLLNIPLYAIDLVKKYSAFFM